jgi:hypothetical protein
MPIIHGGWWSARCAAPLSVRRRSTPAGGCRSARHSIEAGETSEGSASGWLDGDLLPAVLPMGMLLEIVGTARGDRGRNCDGHTCCCEVLQEDVVVRLRREQILVPNKLGKGEKEETAYTVNWVTDGHDRCRVGFLPRAYVAQGGMFDRVLCQVVGVGNESDNDKNVQAAVRHACGYACMQVISPINFG